MKLRRSTIFSGLIGVIFALSFFILQANAEDKPKVLPTTTTEPNKEVLLMAVELNNNIKLETDKVIDERLQIQKNFDDFVTSAKKHRFKDYDMRTKSGLKGYQLEPVLKGTALEGLGDAYAKAETEYSVSSLVLIGISAHESSWGTSGFAKERNNLFGFQAYDSNVDSAKTFKTKEECILTVAKHLSEKYLTDGGAYFSGYTLADANVRYASDKEWNSKITETLNSFVAKMK
jgi:beta-N-acetylglucosaminidase